MFTCYHNDQEGMVAVKWHLTGGRVIVQVSVTCQVGVFGAPGVRQRHQLFEQQRILQDSLNGFDQVRLQGRRVLIGRVSGLQEVLEGSVRLCCNTMTLSLMTNLSGDA